MNDSREDIIDETTNQEQNAETVPDTQEGLISWVKAHKKQLILIGISIPAIIAVVLGIKNEDAIKSLWNQLNEEIKKDEMYTVGWFESVADEVLNKEREKVRVEYCSSGDDFVKASRLQNLLWRFDEEMSKRAWGNETPHAPSIHREHGWYLPNDD